MLNSGGSQTYHYLQSMYVPSDSCYTYRNSIPDAKFFFWFEKCKLTSHLIHKWLISLLVIDKMHL